MSDKEYTLDEAAEILPMGRTTVYDWAKKGKLRSKDTQFGMRIILNESEFNEISSLKRFKNKKSNSKQNGINQDYSENVQNKQDDSEIILNSSEYTLESSEIKKEQNETIQKEKTISENEIILSMIDKMNSMTEKIEEYAKEAGQVKLLTDNKNFYQEEYFSLKYENKKLKDENEALKREIERLKEENKKSVFGWFRK